MKTSDIFRDTFRVKFWKIERTRKHFSEFEQKDFSPWAQKVQQVYSDCILRVRKYVSGFTEVGHVHSDLARKKKKQVPRGSSARLQAKT